MPHVEYLAVLAGGWSALVWTDCRYAGILRQWRRLLVVVALNLSLFLACGYWRSDPRRVIGVWPLPGVPVEELLLLAMVTYASLVLWRIAMTVRRRAPAEMKVKSR